MTWPADRTARPDEPVLDIGHLSAFTGGDRLIEDEILGLYLASAEGYLRAMNDALLEGSDWSGPAHALKGSSANVGARRVEVQARLAEGVPPDPDLLAALRAAVADVQRLFDSRRL